jgi:ABC-type transport system substrate-binding protein
MKKRIVATIMACAMICSMAACGSTDSGTAEGGTQSGGSSDVSEDTGSAVSEAVSSGDFKWNEITEVKPDESRTSTANSDARYDKITVSISNIPSDLSPYTMSNAITNMEIFDTLLEQTDTDEYVGRIAKNWYEEDDTHLVVEIYDYVYDSDGNNITASDVAFSFNTYANSGFARDFNYFDSIEVVDDYTVRFTWTEPIQGLTNFASMMTKTYIVSEKAYNDHDFVTDPVGSGPYVLSDYVTASYAVLEAKDDYWQTDESLVTPCAARNVQTIEYDFISDSSMAEVAFENGDTANVTLNADSLSLFDEGGEYADLGQLVCYGETVTITALPNMNEASLMSDLNMRLAVFYALDTEAFADGLGSDLFAPLTTDASPAIADYSSEWENWDNYQNTYDLELSAEYLKESGYNGETLTILYEGNSEKETVALVMQAYLEAAGITAECVAWDHDLISSHASIADEWDIFLASSGDSTYTANRIRKVYGADAGYTKGEYNISLYDNDEFQDMINADNTVDGNSVEATTEILKYIYDNALGYATAYQVNVCCWSKDVAQFQVKYSSSEVVPGACEYYLD